MKIVEDIFGITSSIPKFALQGFQKEKREREKGIQNVFDEIIAEKSPNLKKETDIRVQEAQRDEPKQTHTKTYHN